jgi:hypothetical protein
VAESDPLAAAREQARESELSAAQVLDAVAEVLMPSFESTSRATSSASTHQKRMRLTVIAVSAANGDARADAFVPIRVLR